MSYPRKSITRRQLLADAAALGAACSLPAWARTPQRKLSANSKANIAFIGVGNYGAQNLTELAGENIVALCD